MDNQDNVYQIYTDNVAPLTPMIAEQLKMDEDEYGSEAVIDAIRIAVLSGVKNMRYIEAILKNKKRSVKRGDHSDTVEARSRYAEIP